MQTHGNTSSESRTDADSSANIAASADHSLSKVRAPKQWFDEESQSYRSDYLYFIHDRASDAIKIGRAMDPQKRFYTICNGNPNDLLLLEAMPNLGWQEAFWHCAFDFLHMRGEWFTANDLLLEAIKAVRQGEDWTDHVPSMISGIEDCDDGEWQEHMLDALEAYEEVIFYGEFMGMNPQRAAEYAIFDPDFDGRCITTRHADALVSMGAVR